MNFLPELTVKYKTYLKTATVEAFRGVFQNHIDKLLQRTKVAIDYPRSEADFPALIIRFFERDIKNAGVGHEEWIRAEDGDQSNLDLGKAYRFKHYFYTGDLEFAIYALSSKDRDLVSDSVVQTIGMGDIAGYTNRFFERIYPDESTGRFPDSIWHYININSDLMQGFGETQNATPWGSEDDLMYQTSYRVRVFGEFYSVPPDAPFEVIAKIVQYPYIAGIEDLPEGDPGDDSPWTPPLDASNDGESF